MDCLPGLFKLSRLDLLLRIDELGLLMFGKLFERFDGLIGANQGLSTEFDLPPQGTALCLDLTDISRELPGIRTPRNTGVDVDFACPSHIPQFVDLRAAIQLGCGSFLHKLFVAAEDRGQGLLAELTLICAQFEQRFEFEREFFHNIRRQLRAFKIIRPAQNLMRNSHLFRHVAHVAEFVRIPSYRQRKTCYERGAGFMMLFRIWANAARPETADCSVTSSDIPCRRNFVVSSRILIAASTRGFEPFW